MKKRTITLLATVMSVCFACLLGLQAHYIEDIIAKRRLHFEETVSRCLYQTVHQVELDEVTRYLEHGSDAMAGIATVTDSVTINTDSTIVQRTHQVTAKDGSVFSSLETTATTNLSDKYFTKKNIGSKANNARTLQEVMAQRYAYDKRLLDEVIYSMIYTASDRPLEERLDFVKVDQQLKSLLASNSINLNYHVCVTTYNGRVVYQCADWDDKGINHQFSETLFANDPVQSSGLLKVHFPDLNDYIYHSIWFITPSILFTLILLVTFIVSIVLVFRQRKVTELKNDFINNMTHEFKTPISSISLAAQMLADTSINKSPQLLNRLTTTIVDETKRLRFQVEKVLQMSMYENQRANLNMRETDCNELIAGIIHTFTLKVEKNGGKIVSHLNAEDPVIYIDDMHITNVIFNLMDNAVKYKRDDAALELDVTTWNEPKYLCISIQDNGIGIAKGDLKRIFEKFYRVHTGNLHDVKGFGLGLAYVHKIVTDHKGTIHAESELGIGTKFIIKLPLLTT